MNFKTIRALAVTSAVAVGAVTIGATAIHAASNPTTTTRQNPMTSLVTAISQKFNLSQTDVQKVFDDQQTQMRQEMDAKRAEEQKTRLAAAVTAGKLTRAQSDLITAKQTEMKTFMDSLKDKTETERQTAMKTKMDELKAWATTNNIPEQYALGFGGHMGGPAGEHGGRGGFGGPGGQGGRGMRGGFNGQAGQPAPRATTQTNQ